MTLNLELKPGGEWQAAIFFLVHMSAVSVQQTAVTVAAAISACEKCVQWTMALAILAATTAQLDVISSLVWENCREELTTYFFPLVTNIAPGKIHGWKTTFLLKWSLFSGICAFSGV